MLIREWTLCRNCSLSPRQVGRAYALLCCASLAVGVGFLLRGAWMVLAFSLVELSVVGLALLVYARHALDRERIALSDGCLLVEWMHADECRQQQLDPLRTSVVVPEGGRRSLVTLESRGVTIEVGRFATLPQRRRLARELREALRSVALLR
jgi:uncharacterized membrane protein